MEQTYSQVRLAYEEARENRHRVNNYPTSSKEQHIAEVLFIEARDRLRALVEGI